MLTENAERKAITEKTAINCLEELVRTPSVSGEEQSAVDVFVAHARSLGMRTEIDAAGNAIAARGPESDWTTQLMLLGHIDTVPGDIDVRFEDRALWGRGAVDAKGPLAAMLLAAADAEIPDDVSVVVVAAVGEETPNSPGATAVCRSFHPDACIIGEPSGWNGVTLGYKGRLLVEASSEKSAAHSAGPESSAADDVVEIWHRVLRLVETFNAGRERAFDQVQASVLAMQSDCDGLLSRAELRGGFRLPQWINPRTLEEEIRQLNAGICELRFNGGIPAHATTRNDPVVQALTGAIRQEGGAPRPKLKTGTADLNVVGPVWRCPIAAYGPGDSALDHAPDERIDIDEYLRSIRVLRRAISDLARELRAQEAF